MSESVLRVCDNIPQAGRATTAPAAQPHGVRTQTVVRRARSHIQVLAPLISERMYFAMGITFPHTMLLAKSRQAVFVQGRAWAAFFLLNHPSCAFSLNAVSKAMRRDRTAIRAGVEQLEWRISRARFSKEAYQLKVIAERLERDHDYAPFDVAAFQGIERKAR